MLHSVNIALEHIQLAGLSNRPAIVRKLPNVEKPLLLFVHGFLDNANSFTYLIKRLDDYDCLAVDLAGHGASEHRPQHSHYQLVDYAYDLHCLIKQCELSNVVLIGHSLGGIVCSLLAATQLPAIKGLITIESIGPITSDASNTAEQIADCFKSRDKANARGNFAQARDINLMGLVNMRSSQTGLDASYCKQILERNIRTCEGKTFWRSDPRVKIRSPYRMTEEQRENILENIVCKQCVILGNEGFSELKNWLSDHPELTSKLDAIEFFGSHHVHMESSEQVGAFIQEWLVNTLNN